MNWIGSKKKEGNVWYLLKWKFIGINWIREYWIMRIGIHKLNNKQVLIVRFFGYEVKKEKD